ncbi:MAG: response regulator [Cyclobacteriaceae bacterium]|nr:response regulator [Cyclobacteriaceae bacterium]
MKKLKILYVEDDSINIYVMKRFLKIDFEIEVSVDGEEAIEVLKSNTFDLILMDINLGNGKMDGIEVMNHLRHEMGIKVPVFAITSFAMAGDEEKFLKEGFDDYISKPVEKETIINKIKDYFKL